MNRAADDYLPAVLNCTHHIMWVRPVENGLHQCILCHQVVGRKDVYPKLEDLPPEFQERWDAHEATRPAPAAAPGAKAPEAKAATPEVKQPAATEPKPAVAPPAKPAIAPQAKPAAAEPPPAAK